MFLDFELARQLELAPGIFTAVGFGIGAASSQWRYDFPGFS
jgi:hypothetical protein